MAEDAELTCHEVITVVFHAYKCSSSLSSGRCWFNCVLPTTGPGALKRQPPTGPGALKRQPPTGPGALKRQPPTGPGAS